MVQETNPAESSKVIKKRKPRKPAPPAHNHIYLTNKTPFKVRNFLLNIQNDILIIIVISLFRPN